MNSFTRNDVETKDVHVRFTRIAAVLFALSVIAIAACVYFFYNSQINNWRKLSGHSFEKQFPRPTVDWPNSKTESVEPLDYRWLDGSDSSHARAEIPVNRAIELIASRKLLHLSIQTGQKDPSLKEKN